MTSISPRSPNRRPILHFQFRKTRFFALVYQPIVSGSSSPTPSPPLSCLPTLLIDPHDCTRSTVSRFAYSSRLSTRRSSQQRSPRSNATSTDQARPSPGSLKVTSSSALVSPRVTARSLNSTEEKSSSSRRSGSSSSVRSSVRRRRT